MNAPNCEFTVAITGYSYRMPGGIRTDDDFWRLLGEREIVQEPNLVEAAEKVGRIMAQAMTDA